MPAPASSSTRSMKPMTLRAWASMSPGATVRPFASAEIWPPTKIRSPAFQPWDNVTGRLQSQCPLGMSRLFGISPLDPSHRCALPLRSNAPAQVAVRTVVIEQRRNPTVHRTGTHRAHIAQHEPMVTAVENTGHLAIDMAMGAPDHGRDRDRDGLKAHALRTYPLETIGGLLP